MEETNRIETGKAELRAKLETLVEKAKDVCERLQDETAAATKATDRAVREHPYHATGIAFGLGILIGVVLSRRGRD